MKELAKEIRDVIITLQQLNIPCSYDNMNKLLGCLQALARVEIELNKTEEKETEEAVSAE